MNSYKKLVSNSAIFAVGNLGSKLISFLLVPLYTYYLSTSEYGTVDLTITTVNMLLPIVSLSIFEAVLRFVMDKENDSEVILSNSIVIAALGFVALFLFYPILRYFNVLEDNLIYLYIILFFLMYEKIFAQYTRAVGKIKLFAINGILLTFTTGFLNIVFLVYLNMGVVGYYLAMILAYAISVVFLIVSTKAYSVIHFGKLKKSTMQTLLAFSIPMVPNSLMWWLINASSRYFIRIFVGISANGLFAVASRIPSLLNIVNQIFTQAWQLSAIEEFNSKNKSEFYTNVFSYLSAMMFIGTSVVLVILKPAFETLFASDFYTAWKVVPFLLLGAVFSSFSGFLGTNYVAAKQTKGVFKTSVYGGIISLVLNGVFIPTMGVVGAGLSSMLSFFVMFIIRFYDTREYIKMKIRWKNFLLNLAVLLLQTGILLIDFSRSLEIVIQIGLLIVIIIINKNLLKPIKLLVKRIVKKKR